jgi:hypothetical protein
MPTARAIELASQANQPLFELRDLGIDAIAVGPDLSEFGLESGHVGGARAGLGTNRLGLLGLLRDLSSKIDDELIELFGLSIESREAGFNALDVLFGGLSLVGEGGLQTLNLFVERGEALLLDLEAVVLRQGDRGRQIGPHAEVAWWIGNAGDDPPLGRLSPRRFDCIAAKSLGAALPVGAAESRDANERQEGEAHHRHEHDEGFTGFRHCSPWLFSVVGVYHDREGSRVRLRNLVTKFVDRTNRDVLDQLYGGVFRGVNEWPEGAAGSAVEHADCEGSLTRRRGDRQEAQTGEMAGL